MFTVYKITNLINQKYYIGVHQTNDPHDNYMGSGIAIKNAIKKYGNESFSKEILFITESKTEAYTKERELTIDFSLESNYNMRLGGVGGFTRENAKKGNAASLKKLTPNQLSENGKKGYAAGLGKLDLVALGKKGGLTNKGKPKSEKHKQSLRETWIKKKNARIVQR